MKQLGTHQYSNIKEQAYAIAAMGLLEKFTGERTVPLGSNDSTEYVLELAAEAHSKIHQVLDIYLKPGQLVALYLTSSVYPATSWIQVASGLMKEINANPLLLLKTTSDSPLAEVLYRMAYGTMHPMVLGSEQSYWRFSANKEEPELYESNYFTESSRIDLNYLITFDQGDLEKRNVVEVKLPGDQKDILRMEWRRDGIWYSLKRPSLSMSYTTDKNPEWVDFSLADLYAYILNLGFVGTANPFITTAWECNIDLNIPVGFGIIIPHDQINHYGALRLK